MTYGTKADIFSMARDLSGTGNDFQITDSVLEDLLDSFYLYDFPAKFRSLKLKDKYIFRTIQGINVYAFDSENYETVQMPCTVEKGRVQLYQTPDQFYGAWGLNNGSGQQFQDNFDFGDDSNGPYSGTVTAINAPSTWLVRSVNTNLLTNPNHIGIEQNLLITANTASGTLNVWDDGNGNLIGDVLNGPSPIVPGSSGTINYQTGVITGLLFSQNIPQGNPIQIQCLPVQLNIPLAILFFQNQFTLMPPPDQGYTVELVAYRRPSQALDNPNNFYPELTEWWETLAYGIALKIYERRLDPDGIKLMEIGLQKRYDNNETRTYAQLGKQRMPTTFAGQLDNGTGNGYGDNYGS
jgi:hypothetical protein